MTPAARDLSVYFGGPPPKDPEAYDLMAVLEYAHPHVAERIKATWGDQLCAAYMSDLMVPARTGRQGFSEHAAKALMDLIRLHDKLWPQKADMWESRP